MGKFVNDVKGFFDFCDKNEVKFVSFRFTDIKGMWHHMSYNLSALNEESFTDGIEIGRASCRERV